MILVCSAQKCMHVRCQFWTICRWRYLSSLFCGVMSSHAFGYMVRWHTVALFPHFSVVLIPVLHYILPFGLIETISSCTLTYQIKNVNNKPSIVLYRSFVNSSCWCISCSYIQHFPCLYNPTDPMPNYDGTWQQYR